MTNPWNPTLYQEKHRFVWELSRGLVEVLNPQPGERILDLGCGTGELTQAIAARGAMVIGLDADPAMIAVAQAQFPAVTFQVADARSFSLSAPVDAIFSNAAFHWINDHHAVALRLAAALKPAGRLVVEFGGKGNMAVVVGAIAAARQNLGFGASPADPWFFPAIGEYASLLESHGFEVTDASLYDRPTQLEGESGLLNWLHMFGSRYWADLHPEQQTLLLPEIENLVRPHLYQAGVWWADYRRIRVCAHKVTSNFAFDHRGMG